LNGDFDLDLLNVKVGVFRESILRGSGWLNSRSFLSWDLPIQQCSKLLGDVITVPQKFNVKLQMVYWLSVDQDLWNVVRDEGCIRT